MGQWRIWAVKTKFSTKLLISRANTVQLEIHAFVSIFVFAADLLQRGSNVFCHYMFQKYLIFFFFLFRVLRQAQKNISEASENQWGTFRGYLQGGTSYIMGNIIFGTRDPSFGDKLKCLMKCFRWLKNLWILVIIDWKSDIISIIRFCLKDYDVFVKIQIFVYSSQIIALY